MMRYVATTVVLCAVATVTPRAQEPAAQTRQVMERHVALDGKIQNTRVAVESRLTKNAPYSAEAITESTQLLADGNRIVTKNSTRIFRDGEGRTRREQLNAAGSDVVNINISDPVAGTTYVLDPGSHMAYRNGLIFTIPDGGAMGSVGFSGGAAMMMTRTPEGGVSVARTVLDGKSAAEGPDLREAKLTDEIKMRTAGALGDVATFVTSGLLPRTAEGVGKTTREEIGQQMIEGVMAVGTRSQTEIPAGAIGNEQPIKIVSEQWFSPELQVLVMTRHIDPRMGETVYRLTGIVRAEPAHALFDVPADYTLNDSVIRRDDR